ncbi:replication initiation factor domain-containing protein [Haploplasma modicum]|uniref:replication initiation factor domain-containing protein n=1 Tax=Haploplasma modicum TaxID=2150 RepID=UPI00047BA316|nr:replication initiation factor domain-containing protein [Haploplasma modicum]
MTNLDIKTGVHIVIDYFSATFPLIVHENDYELKVIEDVIEIISKFLGYDKSNITKEEYAQNRFEYQYLIGSDIVLRMNGPRLKSGYKSCSIELKGSGCREFENNNPDKTWIDFFEFFLVRLNASPSRFDIAIDDYDGSHLTIDEIKAKLDKGFYTTNFRDKDYTLYNSKKGMTLQFGSRISTQMLVIYDKKREQLSQGIAVPETYWTRFEMRYYKEKSYNVCMNILKGGSSKYKEYVLGLLYEMLDIKEDNNFSKSNIYKADTDERWLSFLGEVKKAKIVKYKIRKSSYESYYKWASPHAAFFFLSIYTHSNFDLNSTLIEIVENGISLMEDLNNNRLKKINQFLSESSLKKTNLVELNNKIKELEKFIEIKELPF